MVTRSSFRRQGEGTLGNDMKLLYKVSARHGNSVCIVDLICMTYRRLLI